MTAIQLKELVGGLGLPYAYYQFTKDTAKPPPFICYYLTGSDDFAADGVNYAKIRQLVIELYTKHKDFELEAQIESALRAAGIFYTVAETPIDSQQMYMTVYTSEILFE